MRYSKRWRTYSPDGWLEPLAVAVIGALCLSVLPSLVAASLPTRYITSH